MKPGGDFIACFYIKGKSKRTDWLVKNILAKKGWFSPPFQNEEDLRDILKLSLIHISMCIRDSILAVWFLAIGAGIGLIGSGISIRKYLKA